MCLTTAVPRKNVRVFFNLYPRDNEYPQPVRPMWQILPQKVRGPTCDAFPQGDDLAHITGPQCMEEIVEKHEIRPAVTGSA